MTVKCYVKIVGTHQGDFKGDSTDAGHKDAIEGLSVDYAVTRPVDDSSGHTTGRPQHVPFQITMLSGPATPQLLGAMLTDEQLKSVTIEFAQPAPKQGEVVVVESILITDAQIVDFQHHLDTDPATASGRLLDRVALKFHTFQITNTTSKTTATDTWP